MEYSKTVILKNGTPCLLRSGTVYDGAAALDNFILTHTQTDNLLSYPDEITCTAQQEAEHLRKKAESDDAVEILAFIDGALAGMAGIDRISKHSKLFHRAEFGISVDKRFWGIGIGRALTSACIECAKAAGYTQLELDVMADNKAAIRLYKSVGFCEYGRNPQGFRFRDGTFHEAVLMRLEL